MKHRLGAIALSLLYLATLTRSHELVESRLFEYQGMPYDPPTLAFTLLGFAVVALLAAIMPLRLERPSDLFLVITFATFSVPVAFMPYHATKSPATAVAVLVLVLSAAIALLTLLLHRRGESLVVGEYAPRTFLVVLGLLAIGAIAVIITSPGFSTDVGLADLYYKRLTLRDALGDGSLRGYLIGTAAHAVGPAGMAFGLAAGSWIVAILGMCVSLSVFFLNGAKYSFVVPFAVVAFYFIARFLRRYLFLTVVSGAICIVGLSQFRFLSVGDPVLSESITRRIILSKGASSGHYWEAFRDRKMWFRDSGARRILGLQVAEGKSYVIGQIYGLGIEDNSGANAWAAMYANAGYVGVLAVTFAMAFLLRMIDRIHAAIPEVAATIIAGLIALLWGEASFETSLISTGVLLLIVLLRWFAGAFASAELPSSRSVDPA